MRTRTAWPLWAGVGILSLVAGILALHFVHAVIGHRSLTTFGPAIAIVLVLGSVLTLPRGGTPLDRLTLAAILLLLMLGSEWLEAELGAGHRLTSALAGHARPVAVTLGAAFGVAVLLEAERAITAVRQAFR